ncbi:MAG: cyclic nucleotide-binding domain-containing protein, partial [Promethearchaeota archaeon]
MEEKKQAPQKNTKTCPIGEEIIKEGDLGEEMYIIKSGKVEVIREMGDSEIVLTRLRSNEFFGEMALFGDPKRSATVRAAEKTELLVVTKKMLELQFKKVPEWLVVMIKTIAQRILTTAKGVKTRFPLGMDYTILATILLLMKEHGAAKGKDKSMVINL